MELIKVIKKLSDKRDNKLKKDDSIEYKCTLYRDIVIDNVVYDIIEYLSSKDFEYSVFNERRIDVVYTIDYTNACNKMINEFLVTQKDILDDVLKYISHHNRIDCDILMKKINSKLIELKAPVISDLYNIGSSVYNKVEQRILIQISF